ncbi:hypothetical protein [Arenimonas alkanexedens]
MRRTPLLLALLLALPVAGQASEHRVADWPGGEAQIMSYAPGGSVLVGQIADDGTVSLALPETASMPQPLGKTFPSCLEDGTAIASPEEAAFVPTSLFASRDGEELGALHLATDAAMVAWRASWGQGDAPTGAWLQWVHVDQAATVTAECVQPTYTDPEATDEYPQTTDYRVTLAPGWNLLRYSITSLHLDPTGRNHPRLTEVDALEDLPEDAQWFFEAY